MFIIKSWVKPVNRYIMCPTCFIPIPIEYWRSHQKREDSLNDALSTKSD